MKILSTMAFALGVGLMSAYAQSITPPTVLIVKKYPLDVDGQHAVAFRIEQPDGGWGYHGVKGQYFDAIVKNQTDQPTSIHWHGLIVPNDQDGVPYVTQQPIPPGGEYHYHFKLQQSGTYWMHSHFGMQVQQYFSAPLIIADPAEKSADKDVILFLADFSKKTPQAILHDLQHASMNDMAGMDMDGISKHDQQPDLNDLQYDAYLTNYKTLKNPEIVNVIPGETVRLRIIDGAAASNFWINIGKLQGRLIAVDGAGIWPLSGQKFQLAIGQRLDIVVKIPAGVGVYPILAQGEGVSMQTGLILATQGAHIPVYSEQASAKAGVLNNQQELQLKALHPLPARPIQKTLQVNLEGDMAHYIWKINGQVWPKITPLMIKPNQRVAIVFNNLTGMAHPMHLHGHTFEVTEIDGKSVPHGALRDTILVLPHSTVKVQFDAENSGHWMLHCHTLYHQESGMMTLMNYE